MAEYPVITESDGTTPAVPFFVSFNSGESDGPREFWAVNDPGGTHADAEPIVGSHLRVEGKNQATGQWAQEGLNFLNDRRLSIEVFGVDNAADSSMPPQVTGTVPVGTGSVVWLDRVSKDCARKFRLTFSPPVAASPGLYQYRVVWSTKTSSVVLAAGTYLSVGAGVIPSYRTGAMAVVEGLTVTADGSDTVTVARGLWDALGLRHASLEEDVALDLNASDGALAAGQSYYALLSKKPSDDTTTVTRGLKGAAPAEPAWPAEVPIARVHVAYQAGGSPLIVQADVDSSKAPLGDYAVFPGTGLQVEVYPGTGVGGDRQHVLAVRALAPVPDDATSYLWVRPSGELTITAALAAPEPGSDLLARVVAAAGVVAVTDLREYVDLPLKEQAESTSLSAALSQLATPYAVPGMLVLATEAELHLVTLDLDQLDATWTTGSVKVDLLFWNPGASMAAAGASVFTGSGTDDQRPSVAWDAAFLRSESKYNQARRFVKGTRFAWKIVSTVAAPAAEPARTLLLQAHFRRSR